VWTVLGAVEQMDLSRFRESYRLGSPPSDSCPTTPPQQTLRASNTETARMLAVGDTYHAPVNSQIVLSFPISIAHPACAHHQPPTHAPPDPTTPSTRLMSPPPADARTSSTHLVIPSATNPLPRTWRHLVQRHRPKAPAPSPALASPHERSCRTLPLPRWPHRQQQCAASPQIRRLGEHRSWAARPYRSRARLLTLLRGRALVRDAFRCSRSVGMSCGRCAEVYLIVI
jgi:hypothetical protein